MTSGDEDSTTPPARREPAPSGEETTGWRLLPWDSEFFGFTVGRIELTGLDAVRIEAVEAEARQAGVSCLYGYLDPIEFRASYTVQDLGYRFVECSAMFDTNPDVSVVFPTAEVTIRRGTAADLPAVEAAVVRMAPWSRFAVDPRFGVDAAARMHLAWVGRMARCETDAHALMVAESSSGITAFLTRSRAPHPTIETVGTTAPGSGATRALVRETMAWAGEEGVSAGWVAARNINSYRWLANCGFRPAAARYVYHRWLDDGAG